MQGDVIRKNVPECCPVLIDDTQDLEKCENAAPDTIKKCEGGIPNIRFRGFADDWEQRKLGGLCDITTGKLDANAMVQDGQFDFYTSGVDVYKIDRAAFEGPAITIAGNGASVGYMHLVDGKFNAYQRTYVLTGFLADRQFLNVAIGNELPAKIQEEVRGSGIPYIVLNMLTELNIPFPSHNEQKQIGEFFRNLDHLITLHQRKCDETKELKKYMLQKMFPRDGEKVPEIRFQGFTDDWEQRKLGDIAKTTIGEFVIKTKQDDSYPYPVFNGGSSNTGFYNEFNNEGNKILVSARGANAGFVNIIRTRYWAGNSCYSIDLLYKNEFDTDFIFQEMKRNQARFTENQQAANIPSVSKTDVEKFVVDVPSYAEQLKIYTGYQSAAKRSDLGLSESIGICTGCNGNA